MCGHMITARANSSSYDFSTRFTTIQYVFKENKICHSNVTDAPKGIGLA